MGYDRPIRGDCDGAAIAACATVAAARIEQAETAAATAAAAAQAARLNAVSRLAKCLDERVRACRDGRDAALAGRVAAAGAEHETAAAAAGAARAALAEGADADRVVSGSDDRTASEVRGRIAAEAAGAAIARVATDNVSAAAVAAVAGEARRGDAGIVGARRGCVAVQGDANETAIGAGRAVAGVSEDVGVAAVASIRAARHALDRCNDSVWRTRARSDRERRASDVNRERRTGVAGWAAGRGARGDALGAGRGARIHRAYIGAICAWNDGAVGGRIAHRVFTRGVRARAGSRSGSDAGERHRAKVLRKGVDFEIVDRRR